MPHRPPSSVGSSRPFTSDGYSERPQTARAPSSSGYLYDPQYTYSQDGIIDEEEEEESDDEDVFAYLPPSTADQQDEHQEAPLQSTEITSPPPTFDPMARFPADYTPNSPAPYSRPFSNIPVETPPSTDSQQSHTHTDWFRMRRVHSSGSPTVGRQSLSRRTRSSRDTKEFHVELPSGDEKIDDNIGGSTLDGKDQRRSIDSADVGMTPSMLDFIDEESHEGSIKMDFDLDAIEEEDSPYPEVRASVSNVDDSDMPALTFRVWTIGLLLCVIGSAMNTFFLFRQPSLTIAPIVLVLLAHPIGKILALALPIKTYRTPRWLGSFGFSLNPGPWNIKEHALIWIMADVSLYPADALNIIVVAEIYYNMRRSAGFNLVLVLATQLTGFGLAGLCRHVLVWPASMVWPQTLIPCALLNTLHAEEDEGTTGWSRYKYYFVLSISAFFFFFLPGYLFQALSVFSYICWIAPNNVVVNQVFGVATGMGVGILTFDWTQITWVNSPFLVPLWAQFHVMSSFVLFFWIIAPVLYYTNAWDLSYFPMFGYEPYDRYGQIYDVTRVLQTDGSFNLTAYDEYSPLYLPASFALTYLLGFTLSTCLVVHTVLYHGRSLINGLKRIKVEKDDIHAKLMRNYPEVPNWWYFSVFVTFFCMAIGAVQGWNTGLPVWALLLAIAVPLVYIYPAGFVYALTGQSVALNLIVQVIPGVLLPGRALANLIFKAYSLQTLASAMNFTSDLKLGHYMKIPPRSTFLAQIISSMLTSVVQVGVKEWLFTHVSDICSEDQPSRLTCPQNQVFFTSSAVWGLIGPVRQFGRGSLYYPQLFAIIIGAFLPLPFWLYIRRHPRSKWRLVNTPVFINATSYIPPAVGINYSSFFLVGFISQYIIRRRNFNWWSKYNYLTSAALDSGTSIALIFIFFALQFPNVTLNWWGNNVFKNTADWNGAALRTTPPSGLSFASGS